MAGLPHIDQIKKHFVSGEPGTTGREPFEESISTGKFLPDHLTGKTDSAPHIPSGSLAHGSPIDTTHGSHGTHGLSTHGDDHNRGVASGAGVGAGAGALGTGAATHGTHGAHGSDNTSYNNVGEKKGLVEKVKEKVSGDSSTTHNNNNHNDHGVATGTGVGAAGLGAGAAHGTHGTHGTHDSANPEYKRDVVDKVNDALPGTSAKVPQAYETGDRTTGVSGTQYGAGKHGTEGIVPGVGGVVSGGHGVAGTAHENRMVDKTPESLDHERGLATGAGVGGVGSAGHGLTGSTHDNRTHGALGHNSTTDHDLSSRGATGAGVAGVGAAGAGRGLTGSHQDDRTSNRAHESHDHHNNNRDEPSKGGVAGALGTSDKDFLDRDRKGTGAYADTDGVTEMNTSGPKGNPALTGREGDAAHNPVAQKHGAADTTTSTGEKKGLIQKIKDIL